MTAAKIWLLFAVFSGCCVLLSLFSIFEESFRAPRELVRWLNWKGSHIPTHIFIYILAVVSAPQTTPRTANMCGNMLSCFAPLDDRGDRTNQLQWLKFLPTSYISFLNQAGKGRVLYSVDKCFESGADPRNIFDKFGRHFRRHFTAWSRARLWRRVWKLAPSQDFRNQRARGQETIGSHLKREAVPF